MTDSEIVAYNAGAGTFKRLGIAHADPSAVADSVLAFPGERERQAIARLGPEGFWAWALQGARDAAAGRAR